MSTPPIVTYLRSLEAVRERSGKIYQLALEGKLDHWEYKEDKLGEVVDFCVAIIKRDFGTKYDKIPPHCRRNHFYSPNQDRISILLSHPDFPKGKVDRAAALIDLYLVSVLLDAGAGADWMYTEIIDGKEVWKGGRSEGLAVASYHMFSEGIFSSERGNKFQVDAKALQSLTVEILTKHLQVSSSNPMAGLEGRCNLLISLGSALQARPDICGNGRPGDMLHYFQKHLDQSNKPIILPLSNFWSTLFELLLPIWPSRTTLPSYPDYPLGDVWPCPSLDHSLESSGIKREEGDSFIPFHKLTQWLCYSLVDAIENEAGWKVDRGKGQTGLPEYRNGGLLVDHDVIIIRSETLPPDSFPKGNDQPPLLQPSHPAVVEWRAMTVICLDKIHQLICIKLGVDEQTLSLAQVLEAATWKGGREIAKIKRIGAPVDIISDGTVF
ncbi:hypothetical protein TREMEDRAFT_45681 [Tremella mesenterica DSM 1558]|uniref:uncharacterized protein n=1 Tax=Tremella mesenterica (strain ATCC 24925 / CBS 8224 / DSM 1558 / NBRC 9311 / NRRL Y-6157 / RJB 2259-6 / UBC 559-6) TaxID=578456 RepID=UPI00032CEDB2|nr:uncharacterized protein TREMEDRAFT_45681 [Tremella mesenterica DSM 1558]EIW66550.1 hypothetical protein TREMEDRAFT_45681 [Tremella mesenterica DSM 1558]